MRTFVAKLLILLMTLHILVPAGFMLGRTGDSAAGPTIVMCKGDVFGPLRVSRPGSNTDPANDHAPQSLCPYASFGAIAVDATTPTPIIVPVAYHAVAFPAPAPVRIVGTLKLRPQARAPPYLA